MSDKIDMVNKPPHYQGKVETIDVIESATEHLSGFEGYCIGNNIKYASRWKLKDGVQDLKKARWYLDRLISYLEEKERKRKKKKRKKRKVGRRTGNKTASLEDLMMKLGEIKQGPQGKRGKRGKFGAPGPQGPRG